MHWLEVRRERRIYWDAHGRGIWQDGRWTFAPGVAIPVQGDPRDLSVLALMFDADMAQTKFMRPWALVPLIVTLIALYPR